MTEPEVTSLRDFAEQQRTRKREVEMEAKLEEVEQRDLRLMDRLRELLGVDIEDALNWGPNGEGETE